MQHPARYNNKFSSFFTDILQNCNLVLDPFGGTGKLSNLIPNNVICLEIEPEWATDIIGNALYLPFKDNSFDAICTSPTYGNRMADTLLDNKYIRNTYTCAIGRKLHKDNSGTLQWGKQYKKFHKDAWRECIRVLKPGGIFCLNIKDHIRGLKRQHVTKWHSDLLQKYGLEQIQHYKIETNGIQYGKNPQRIKYESIIHFVKPL
jgi:tRNA G10  N-methylase Trm11